MRRESSGILGYKVTHGVGEVGASPEKFKQKKSHSLVSFICACMCVCHVLSAEKNLAVYTRMCQRNAAFLQKQGRSTGLTLAGAEGDVFADSHV